MSIGQSHDPSVRTPLRVWPGVACASLCLVGMIVPFVLRDDAVYGFLAALVAAIGVVAWWLFFSRAPWPDRIAAIIVGGSALIATKRFVHPSIANAGMDMMMFVFGTPVLSIGLVVGAVAGRRISLAAQRGVMLLAILLASSTFTLLRTGGISGEGVSDLHWRWTPTPEQRLLARAADEPVVPPPPQLSPKPDETPTTTAPLGAPSPSAAPAPTTPRMEKRAMTPAGEEISGIAPAPAAAAVTGALDWPGFRGPQRDGVVRGVQINTDWSASPPRELWRRPVGPGWSSFAVRGNFIYTQEQRGEDEIVAAYTLATGAPVWRHSDPARFWESNGGAGPRATPTVSNGRVYAMGATGIVNALDAATGALLWSRNAASDTGAQPPGWGFAGSPLVIGDIVIVAAAGRLVAYDAASGNPRWFGPTGGGGYSSPQLRTIDGVPQVVLLRGSHTTSVAPADGAVLWEHLAQPSVAIVQPGFTPDGDVLVASGDVMGGNGLRRISVAHGDGGWTVEERWMSTGLKPYFNDFVVHKGYAFGFDGNILACIDLADGTRKWKGGRYGHGQLVLLSDQDLLLVTSEDGDVALVAATPDKFTEVARAPALEGKTWNHPVVVGDELLVRNDHEMAAFRLSLAVR
jgi:outer membrane protein assembly factor BamB